LTSLRFGSSLKPRSRVTLSPQRDATSIESFPRHAAARAVAPRFGGQGVGKLRALQTDVGNGDAFPKGGAGQRADRLESRIGARLSAPSSPRETVFRITGVLNVDSA
jgi:hypothetical protein